MKPMSHLTFASTSAPGRRAPLMRPGLVRLLELTSIALCALCLVLLFEGRALAGQCETNGSCYITPAGAGSVSGVDWNNALKGLPTTWSSANCGVTYYVASGTYDYTSVSNTISVACTAKSPLIIYKAVSGGPGDPQSVAGWVASYGTGQATFSQTTNADPEAKQSPLFTLSGSYITIDGVIPTSGTPSKTATFGFHLQSANTMSDGFTYILGANDTIQHVEYDGVQRPGQYGYQVTACSYSGTTVTLTTNGSPPWVKGNVVDLWMNGGKPTTLSCDPIANPDACGNAATIEGSTITYTQKGLTGSGTCSVTTATTVTLDVTPAGALIVDAPTPSNFTFADNHIHDVGDPIHFIGTSSSVGGCNGGCSFLRNYVARNRSTPTQHSAGMTGSPLNGSVVGQSVFEDMNGTAFIEATNPYGWKGVDIYSNLFFCTIASQDAYYGPPTGATWQSPLCDTSGTISDDDGESLFTDMLVYGNTLIRPRYYCDVVYVPSSTSTVTAINNFAYCPGSTSVKLVATSHSYNTLWAGSTSQAPAPGEGDYWTSSFPAAASVFVDPSDTGENFHLLSATVDQPPATSCKPGTSCLADGMPLPSPYDVDLTGMARVSGDWTRGAFQYCDGGCAALSSDEGGTVDPDEGVKEGDGGGLHGDAHVPPGSDAAIDRDGGGSGGGGGAGGGNGSTGDGAAPGSTSGCGCRFAATDRGGAWSVSGLGLAVLLAARRRRQRRAASR
jgi:hypothetical protein